MSLWESSAFWGIAGIVAGVIVAAFFFYIGKNKKLLEYQVTSTRIITKDMADIPGINITLDGKSVENLTSSTIRFINSGNQTIVPADFATFEPLGATVTGHFFNIHQGSTVTSDNVNSRPQIKVIDSQTLYIQFDFLKPRQSCSITLLHDGVLSVIGELKFGKRHKYDNFYRFPLRKAFPVLLFTSFLLSLGLASYSMGIDALGLEKIQSISNLLSYTLYYWPISIAMTFIVTTPNRIAGFIWNILEKLLTKFIQ